jgi:hypothetical protein
MPSALVGYTGTIGRTLLGETSFDELYNSANISSLAGKKYDLLVCAGAPAAKWKANQDPEADLANLKVLMGCLERACADRLVLISTVDVFARPVGVDEEWPVAVDETEPYGRHRRHLEEFVQAHFPGASVVRLPGLLGKALKKNFVYDLLHQNALHLTHCESVFQFYDLSRLWADLQVVLQHSVPLIHFATGPVKAKEVAKSCFGVAFDNVTERPPVYYDMRTRYGSLFDSAGPYLYSAAETLERIARFVAEQRRANT